MAKDYYTRTEDIKPEDVLDYFVETQKDRQTIEQLKSPQPTILVGSRGVGKSFLLRVAQQELLTSLPTSGILPVYITFSSSPLLQSLNNIQFHAWMLTKICSGISRAVSRAGLLIQIPKSLKVLAGGNIKNETETTPLEKIQEKLEDAWRNEHAEVDISAVPELEDIKDAIEDLITSLKLNRVILFVDEAAHIFLPRQQRLFFSLFRDLRSPYLACKAAVYPGVTSYGADFQPVHDAAMVSAERDILGRDYIQNMREIVEKQADSDALRYIQLNQNNFSTLAYAASGNPRILLKTLSRTPKLSSSEVNQLIKDYYRSEAWSEHSTLSSKYKGHTKLIDWGRNFVEQIVLPTLKRRNDERSENEGSSAFFWIHRDSPQFVQQALQILTYTGLITETGVGLRSKSNEIGTRYTINLGCIFSLEGSPSASAPAIWHRFDVRRMIEFNQNHPTFLAYANENPTLENDTVNLQALEDLLNKSIRDLDLTDWQKETLESIDLKTIRKVLSATESDIQKAYYVGEVRSRRIRNVAMAAIFEYLSG